MGRGKKGRSLRVVGGVDTHADFHHAAVVAMSGRRIADARFPATGQGYAALLAWLCSHGRVRAVGVEGTGSYGKQLAVHLRGQGVEVVEVNRPDRRQRRMRGKSDPLDAYAAAEAVLAGRARVVPKSADGAAEALRMIHTVRAAAVKARTAAINQLRADLVTAPPQVAERLRGLRAAALLRACLELEPGPDPSSPSSPSSPLSPSWLADPAHAACLVLRRLARRWEQLNREIAEADAELAALVAHVRPDLLSLLGVGVEVAAQLLITAGDNPDRLGSEAAFAALCGVNPIPAASGKCQRHRLNRAGDRQANRALHTIAMTRMAHCARTRAYVERRLREEGHGKTKREIIRCLKRYIAREVYKILLQVPATT